MNRNQVLLSQAPAPGARCPHGGQAVTSAKASGMLLMKMVRKLAVTPAGRRIQALNRGISSPIINLQVVPLNRDRVSDCIRTVLAVAAVKVAKFVSKVIERVRKNGTESD